VTALLAPGLPVERAELRAAPGLSVVAKIRDRPVAMAVLTPPTEIDETSGQQELVRVLVLARSPAVRAGLGALLTTDDRIVMVTTPGVASGWLRTSDPLLDAPEPLDAIVVDLPSFAPTALDDIAERFPGTPLVLLGGDPATSPPLVDAPTGYLSTDADSTSLMAAVHAVVAGLTVIDPGLVTRFGARPGTPQTPDGGGETLTPREREVLQLVAEGLPNKTIARELGISEHTAKFHVGSLLAKLDSGSRTEAVTTATRRGLLTV